MSRGNYPRRSIASRPVANYGMGCDVNGTLRLLFDAPSTVVDSSHRHRDWWLGPIRSSVIVQCNSYIGHTRNPS